MGKRRFFAWLSTLIVPLAVISLIDHWPAPPRSPSIGGGGYDLQGLVVTIVTLGFIGTWTLLALIIACFQKDEARQRQGFGLAVIGGFVFVGAMMLYGDNLS